MEYILILRISKSRRAEVVLFIFCMTVSALTWQTVIFYFFSFFFLKGGRLPYATPYFNVSGVLEAWLPYILPQKNHESLFGGFSREAQLFPHSWQRNGSPLLLKVVLCNLEDHIALKRIDMELVRKEGTWGQPTRSSKLTPLINGMTDVPARLPLPSSNFSMTGWAEFFPLLLKNSVYWR